MTQNQMAQGQTTQENAAQERMTLGEYCEIIENSHPALKYCERFDQNSSKWITDTHSHPYIELIFFLEGKAGVNVDGMRLNASIFDTLVYPAGCEHLDGKNLEMDCEIICLWIEMPELVLDKPILMHEKNRDVRSLFLFIYEEWQRADKIPYVVENAIKLLLMIILRDRDANDGRELFLNRIISYIDRHYTERITLDELAEVAHVSRSYLTRRFRQHTGTSIVSHINSLRIGAARELLINSSFNSTEIAYRTGFESPKYFYRVFKKETGFSPAAYRARYKTVSIR